MMGEVVKYSRLLISRVAWHLVPRRKRSSIPAQTIHTKLAESLKILGIHETPVGAEHHFGDIRIHDWIGHNLSKGKSDCT